MHPLIVFYHALIKAGLYHTLLAAFINVVVVGVGFGAFRSFLRKLWHQHLDSQAKIAQHLATVNEAQAALKQLEQVQKDLRVLQAAAASAEAPDQPQP